MSYSSTVLADSPLGYWRMGDASGTTMTDSSGNAHNGTYSNVTLAATGLLTGDADTAGSFNGSSSECTVTNGSWMNTSSVTYEAIIKPSDLSAYHVFMNRDSGTFRGSMFRTTPSAKLEIEFRNNSGTLFTATGTTSLSTGTTYHVAAVFDSSGNALKMYLNGVQEGSTVTTSGTAFSNGLPIGLGVYSGVGTFWWNGVIDEVAYYGSALSSVRIAAHYTAATSASPDATVTPPAATATAAARVPVVSASSVVTPPAATATALAVPPTIGAGGNATVSPPAATATATALAPTITQVIPAGTDTSNSLNGRRRRARASVVVTTPAAVTPSRAAVKYDKSVPYPPPTLVNGRPV